MVKLNQNLTRFLFCLGVIGLLAQQELFASSFVIKCESLVRGTLIGRKLGILTAEEMIHEVSKIPESIRTTESKAAAAQQEWIAYLSALPLDASSKEALTKEAPLSARSFLQSPEADPIKAALNERGFNELLGIVKRTEAKLREIGKETDAHISQLRNEIKLNCRKFSFSDQLKIAQLLEKLSEDSNPSVSKAASRLRDDVSAHLPNLLDEVATLFELIETNPSDAILIKSSQDSLEQRLRERFLKVPLAEQVAISNLINLYLQGSDNAFLQSAAAHLRTTLGNQLDLETDEASQMARKNLTDFREKRLSRDPTGLIFKFYTVMAIARGTDVAKWMMSKPPIVDRYLADLHADFFEAPDEVRNLILRMLSHGKDGKCEVCGSEDFDSALVTASMNELRNIVVAVGSVIPTDLRIQHATAGVNTVNNALSFLKKSDPSFFTAAKSLQIFLQIQKLRKEKGISTLEAIEELTKDFTAQQRRAVKEAVGLHFYRNVSIGHIETPRARFIDAETGLRIINSAQDSLSKADPEFFTPDRNLKLFVQISRTYQNLKAQNGVSTLQEAIEVVAKDFTDPQLQALKDAIDPLFVKYVSTSLIEKPEQTLERLRAPYWDILTEVLAEKRKEQREGDDTPALPDTLYLDLTLTQLENWSRIAEVDNSKIELAELLQLIDPELKDAIEKVERQKVKAATTHPTIYRTYTKLQSGIYAPNSHTHLQTSPYKIPAPLKSEEVK